MKMEQTEPTPLFCDNQGVIKLAKNPIFHECTKHVEVHFNFIKYLVYDLGGSMTAQNLTYSNVDESDSTA